VSDAFLALLSFVLVFLGILAVICAWELARLARIAPVIPATNDRRDAAIAAAAGGLIGATLGLNRLGIPNTVALVMLALAITSVSIPSVLWLARYRRDLLIRGVAVATTGAVITAMLLVTRQ
jgi:hypothetical protein